MFNSNYGASVPLVANIDGNGGNGNGMFGNDSWIGLIIILALLGGGLGNGFGFGGNNGSRGGYAEPYATQSDVRAAVDQQTLISKLDQQTYGLADSTYALNNSITNGFNGVQSTLCQGFNGIDRAIADCCCTTQRAIDGVNYNMATQACDIKHAINDSTRSILDFLTTDKIATLQAENQSLKFKASQAEQNAYLTATMDANRAELIRRLGADCPVNAVVVQPPTPVTFPTNCCGQFNGYNNYNTCGCA
jgi:hypothetical protein